MSFLLGLHSGIRWIVVAVSLIAAVWFLLVWLRQISNPQANRILMLLFTISLDIQVLIGIIHLIERIAAGTFYGGLLEHAVTMLIAVGVAHFSRRWKEAEPPVCARNNLIVIVVSLVLIFIAVARLPNGMTRWGFSA